MAVRRDILAKLPQSERVQLMRRAVKGFLGDAVGEQVWRQMKPALVSAPRQLGDAPAPEENYWRGRWRIYEAD